MVKEGENSQNLPRNAQAISLILQSMGVDDAEPRVIHQLMDFVYRTTTDFLESAANMAEHAGRSEISVEDVKLAIQSRVSSEFTGPPPREMMAEFAAEKNQAPLPIIPEKFGLRLPADRYCLTQPNYKVLGLIQPQTGNEQLTQTQIPQHRPQQLQLNAFPTGTSNVNAGFNMVANTDSNAMDEDYD